MWFSWKKLWKANDSGIQWLDVELYDRPCSSKDQVIMGRLKSPQKIRVQSLFDETTDCTDSKKDS